MMKEESVGIHDKLGFFLSYKKSNLKLFDERNSTNRKAGKLEDTTIDSIGRSAGGCHVCLESSRHDRF